MDLFKSSIGFVLVGLGALVVVVWAVVMLQCLLRIRRRRASQKVQMRMEMLEPPFTSLPLRRSTSRGRMSSRALEDVRTSDFLLRTPTLDTSSLLTTSQATLSSPRPNFAYALPKLPSHSLDDLPKAVLGYDGAGHGSPQRSTSPHASYSSAEAIPLPTPALLRSRSLSHLAVPDANSLHTTPDPAPSAPPHPLEPMLPPLLLAPPSLTPSPPPTPTLTRFDGADPFAMNGPSALPSRRSQRSVASYDHPLASPSLPSLSASAASPSRGRDSLVVPPSPASSRTSKRSAHRRSVSCAPRTGSGTWRPTAPSAWHRQERAAPQNEDAYCAMADADATLVRGRSVDSSVRARGRRDSSGSRTRRRLVKRKRSTDGGALRRGEGPGSGHGHGRAMSVGHGAYGDESDLHSVFED